MIKINFLEDKIVEDIDSSKTILQISLQNEIPMMYACGGNARCSTCRVIILEGLENIEPRNEAEAELASKKNLEDNIRLSCQTKISGDIKLRRLVIDEEDIEIAVSHNGVTGREEKIAVMFTDIRGFTSFSEKALPYDVIHILNRYFQKMGKTVLANSGYIDKYIGDGLMALFGVGNTNAFEVCQTATKAAVTMIEELHSLNLYLQKHFSIQFQIGIGLHFGSVILGEIGHPEKKQFTAIGDNVNFASRIESTTKKAGAEILASDVFYEIIKNSVSKERIFETNIKGKTGKYRLYEIKKLLNPTISKIEKIETYLQEKISTVEAPAYIRLAFHDAGNYSVETSRGGLDGSIQFELDREENKGLDFYVTHILIYRKDLKLMGLEITFADLIAVCTKIALEKLGGPKLEIALGRIDALAAGERMKTPHVNFTIDELISAFQKMGLDEKDLVVLSGAHTVGVQNKIAFTESPYEFDNSYFQNLLDSELSKNLIDTDRVLLKSSTTLQLVLDYASDKELFLKDFKASMEKLLNLSV